MKAPNKISLQSPKYLLYIITLEYCTYQLLYSYTYTTGLLIISNYKETLKQNINWVYNQKFSLQEKMNGTLIYLSIINNINDYKVEGKRGRWKLRKRWEYIGNTDNRSVGI